jgi:hypothetical protein
VNLVFKKDFLPKSQQEYQFKVIQTSDNKTNKNCAIPTTFIDLSSDQTNK